MTVILLKNNDLTINTSLGGSIDPQRYLHCIKDAQKTELKPMIGTALYTKLMLDFKENELEGVYKELYDDYVKDFIIHQAASLYLAIGAYQVSNAGITKTSTDNTTTVNKEELDYLVVHQRNLANHYLRQMIKFLKLNLDEIPEYKTLEIKPENKTFYGLYLPKTRKRKGY